MIKTEEKSMMIKLKEIRTELNLTQSDLAEQLQIKRNTLCDWELGKSEPSINHLKNLSQILLVSIDMLVDHPVNTDFKKHTLQEIALKKQIQELTLKEQETLLNILKDLEGRDEQ